MSLVAVSDACAEPGSEVVPLTGDTNGSRTQAHSLVSGGRLMGVLSMGLLLAGAVVLLGRNSEALASTDAASAIGLVSVKKKSGHKDNKESKDAGKKDDGPDFSKCSWGRENCNKTQCCNAPGMQCYEQGSWYAQCKESCIPGPDPTHWDGVAWSCKELGNRKEGEAKCSAQGEDCRETQCCSIPNSQCFAKNKDWATCKSECKEGSPDFEDANGDPWECKPLGEWTRGPSDWVYDQCSQEGDDCTESQCCAVPGMQCFKQSDFWAQCKYDCAAKDPDRPWEPDWTCETLGTRTPGTGGIVAGKVGSWVLDVCADEGQDCRKGKCCLGNNMQCYEKNKDWGMCMESCVPGNHSDDNNEAWTCNELGPRLTSGLALQGAPSLFCFSLFQVDGYEMGIMKVQLNENAGIFQCDDWALLSTDAETVLGSTPDGVEAKTIHVEPAEITTSVDGTAGNAQLFINCWNAVIADGRWKRHAWIIKVDPDAVIVPYRMRDHLRMHVMENVYVVNCNKFPSSPNFPMMYGSIEVFSFMAIKTYSEKIGQCIDDMGMMLPSWGEDYFMTHCLDHIGVGRISDFVSVGDNVCTGGSCADGAFAAFHPFKSSDEWQNCWDQAMGKIQPPPPEWM